MPTPAAVGIALQVGSRSPFGTPILPRASRIAGALHVPSRPPEPRASAAADAVSAAAERSVLSGYRDSTAARQRS
jgi:hypothetical protein